MTLLYGTDYASKLAERFGIDQTEALEAINHELEDLADGAETRDAVRLASASDRIEQWLAEGAGYDLPETYEAIGKFCREHRRACAWAVLTAKAKAKEAVDAQR